MDELTLLLGAQAADSAQPVPAANVGKFARRATKRWRSLGKEVAAATSASLAEVALGLSLP